MTTQIFSVTAVGTQSAPTIGGVLYKKSGVTGVFGLAVALLVVDFVMRLIVIEKKVAAKYEEYQQINSNEDNADEDDEDEPDEESPLLDNNNKDHYRLDPPKNWLIKHVPILACFKDPALIAALWLGFVQAMFLGSFDSTIPTVAEDYYDFDSLKVGVLFLALGIPDLIMGPPGGWAVDKYGTKPVATFSCVWLTPLFFVLRVIKPGGEDQIKLWAALLAIIGIGMGIFGAPSIVESGAVAERYYKANPDFFGNSGPYAQLYGLSSMCFCAGLALGPVMAGTLKDTIGYGNMNAILGGLAAVTGVVSFLFIGGKPKILRKDV